LYVQCPVLLATLPGYVRLLRERRWRAEGLVAAVSLAALLWMNAGYFVWWAGSSFGPRYLIPALPFQCLPLLFVPRRLAPAAAALAALSVLQMLVVTAADPLVPSAGIERALALG